MTFKTRKKPTGSPSKPQNLPKPTFNAPKNEPTTPAALPRLKPRATAPTGTGQNNPDNDQNTAPPTETKPKITLPKLTLPKITPPVIKDPQVKADAQLIGRVLDTQPKFAQLIANQAASGQLSGKQVNDLAALAKHMQVKGKNDPQVVRELAKAMNGMNPSASEVFWQEFARGMKQDTGNNLKQFGLGAIAAGKQNVLGLGNALRHPLTTAKGIGQMVVQEPAKGLARTALGAQAAGFLPGNQQAAQTALKQQINAAGQYIGNIAADPKKIGAVTGNAITAALPVPGGNLAANLTAKAGTTAAGKAALGAVSRASVKVGAIANIGKGLSGKITKIVTGKDGKQYAFVQTSAGQKKVLADSISTSTSEIKVNGAKNTAYSVINETTRQTTKFGVNYFRTNELRRIMSRTEAGQKVLAAADSGTIEIKFSTGKSPQLYGEAYTSRPGSAIDPWAEVFVPSTQNGREFNLLNKSVGGYEHTAAIALHEGLHALGIAGSRRAEALSRLAELELHGIPIDRKAIRQVLTDMKGNYDNLPWQQKSSSLVFRGVRF